MDFYGAFCCCIAVQAISLFKDKLLDRILSFRTVSLAGAALCLILVYFWFISVTKLIPRYSDTLESSECVIAENIQMNSTEQHHD